jgi:hypothetical protein
MIAPPTQRSLANASASRDTTLAIAGALLLALALAGAAVLSRSAHEARP